MSGIRTYIEGGWVEIMRLSGWEVGLDSHLAKLNSRIVTHYKCNTTLQVREDNYIAIPLY